MTCNFVFHAYFGAIVFFVFCCNTWANT